MKTLFILITLITFIIFFVEALIHFNIGKNGGNKTHEYIRVSDNIKMHVPDKNEFFEIFITVLIFSSISGLVSSYFIHYHL